MNHMFEKYPSYLSLDVSTDNDKAISFYSRLGLEIAKTYISQEKIEFAMFQTPPNFKPTPFITPSTSKSVQQTN